MNALTKTEIQDFGRAQLMCKWLDRQPKKGSIEAEIRAMLGLTPKQWRKLLVRLTNVVETQMCSNNWSEINFSHVPSVASLRYTKAFTKHDPSRYVAWKESLAKGEAKVNVGAVYPHDIVLNLRNGDAQLANEMWNSLPNFLGDSSIMPIVDVSGSMGTVVQGNVTAMDISIALGMYCAQKCRGPFQDLFITFSATPQFVQLNRHATLNDNYNKTRTAKWGMNTDLQRAFNLLLTQAINNNASPKDMPEMLLIISDMEFDACAQGTNYQLLEAKYNAAGYKMSKVCFWNVCARPGNSPVRYNQQGVALISGYSPSIMKSVLAAEEFTPESVMNSTIMSDRYSIPFN